MRLQKKKHQTKPPECFVPLLLLWDCSNGGKDKTCKHKLLFCTISAMYHNNGNNDDNAWDNLVVVSGCHHHHDAIQVIPVAFKSSQHSFFNRATISLCTTHSHCIGEAMGMFKNGIANQMLVDRTKTCTMKPWHPNSVAIPPTQFLGLWLVVVVSFHLLVARVLLVFILFENTSKSCNHIAKIVGGILVGWQTKSQKHQKQSIGCSWDGVSCGWVG